MAIEIADIQLNRVHRIEAVEHSRLVYHRVPGMAGSAAQTMGRHSVRLRIAGIFYGETAQEDLEKLRQVYKQQTPVDFLADIVGQAYFSQVILERFEVVQAAQDPDQFTYSLTVAEWVADAKTQVATGSSAVNANIKADAASFMTAVMLPDALQIGALPEITNPIEPLKTSLDPVQEGVLQVDGAIADLKVLFHL